MGMSNLRNQRNRDYQKVKGYVSKARGGEQMKSDYKWGLVSNLIRSTIVSFVMTTVFLWANVAVAQQDEDCWSHETFVFQQGVNSYSGTEDVGISAYYANTSLSHDDKITVDDYTSSGTYQALLRFSDIYGNLPNQIQANAPVESASLKFYTESASRDDGVSAHRMLIDWNCGTTWNAMGNGIQANNTEAASTADDVLYSQVSGGFDSFDVTASVEAWSLGQSPNYGWGFINSGSDGWDFYTSERSTQSQKPQLFITLDGCIEENDLPPPPQPQTGVPTCQTGTLSEHTILGRLEQKDGTSGQGYYIKNTDDFLGDSGSSVVSLSPTSQLMNVVIDYYADFDIQMTDFFVYDINPEYYGMVFEGPGGTWFSMYIQIDNWRSSSCDSDFDGIQDHWEQAVFGNLNQNAQTDSDGDGTNDYLEYIVGTDPNNGLSKPGAGNHYKYDALGRVTNVLRMN
jgi:hypothetical protein